MSARGVKGRKRKRKTRPNEDKAQSEGFIKLARELEADETGKAFERALRILKKRHPS